MLGITAHDMPIYTETISEIPPGSICGKNVNPVATFDCTGLIPQHLKSVKTT